MGCKMKASDLNRNLPQYKELYEIDDKDEFLHCFAYELAIRSIKDRLEKEFEAFYIEDGKVVLKQEEFEKIAKELNHKNVKPEYVEIVKNIARDKNTTPTQKAILYKLKKLEDDIAFETSLMLHELHIEYTFFSDNFKKIFYTFFGSSKPLFLHKTLYDGMMESEAYFHSKFIRSYIFSPKKRNDDFRDIRTHYTLRYRRPMFHGTILSNNRKADITINADLPKEIIMQQLERLVDIVLEDKENIISNRDKVVIADEIENYERYANEIFKNNRLYIDGLLAYDYIQIREKEIEKKNIERNREKEQKLEYIKKSIEMTKAEKREQTKKINSAYKKIGKGKIKEGAANSFLLGDSTIRTYSGAIKKLLENKNYLKLLDGADIKGFQATI